MIRYIYMKKSQHSEKIASSAHETAAVEEGTVWDRPERLPRPAPVPLLRDQIVQTAIAIADEDGLDAVSLRKIGAALHAGPMRLYGYLSRKEELLDLMVDAVYAEMANPEPLPDQWQDALRTLAHRVRQAVQKHKWFAGLLGGRLHQGPNALGHVESSLAVLSRTPGFEDIELALLAVRVVNAYVIGALQSEMSELRAERESGLSKEQWQAVSAPYIERLIQTGRFPEIARVIRDATHPSPEMAFDQGLDCVLHGIAARMGERKSYRKGSLHRP